MAVFQYTARNFTGSKVTGLVTADTARAARDKLRDKDLLISVILPLSRRRKRSFGAIYNLLQRTRRTDQVNELTTNLATLLAVGIPLADALGTLVRQSRGSVEQLLRDLHEKVSGGTEFWQELSEYPQYFDSVYINMVRAGQASGTLEKSLEQLVQFRSERQTIRNNIRAALTYPAIVAVVGIGVLIFLLTFVVPKILKVLTEAGGQLPFITRILVAASSLLMHQWSLILLVAIGLTGAVYAAASTKKGKLFLHRLIIRIPIIGPLVVRHSLSRFCAILAALLKSGLTFLDSLSVTKSTLTNQVLINSIDTIHHAVQSGSSISAVLAKEPLFPPVVVHMFSVGEQSGELEHVLKQISDAYLQQVQLALRRAMTALEPVVIVFMAVIVGFVVMATLLPILEVSRIL